MRTRGTRRAARVLAVLAVVALLILHNDHWNRDPAPAPVLGWIPADIAYHLIWVGAAALVLGIVLRVTWEDET